ncbi:hypothetical protein NPX13_g5934 [Xylaria arbuscula]|uniref:Homeobox domain-containing protein n=1 Tax=Xylaria arbuscula TaxID=114810 RepID=A0A9W8NCT4_9PEZI|nr:hypothetical protein NPX13_g5934 [Xylaria arbuscula]
MDHQHSYPSVHDEDAVMSDTWWSSAPVMFDDPILPISSMPSNEDLAPGGDLSAQDPSPPTLFWDLGVNNSSYEAAWDFSDAEIDSTLNWVGFETPVFSNNIVPESRPLTSDDLQLPTPKAPKSLANLTAKRSRITINKYQQEILDDWVAKHPEPYPSKEDKIDLAAATGLSVRQVSGWFTRTRQRRLQRVQPDTPTLTTGGVPIALVTSTRSPTGETAEILEDLLGSELLASSAENTYPSSSFHRPRCTSLPPLISAEQLITKSPKRVQSLPHIFTLDVVKYCASSSKSVSQARLSLDVAAPTHESDVFRGHGLDDIGHGLTRPRRRGSIYPLRPISKPTFVEAWIEDVAHQTTFSPDEPPEVANCCSPADDNLHSSAQSHSHNETHQERDRLNYVHDSTIDGKRASSNALQSPSQTAADCGTYVCTYHGCTLRFETAAILQKHKRAEHRTIATLNHLQDPGSFRQVASSPTNHQAWPHKCDSVDLSTGKPCNIVFSRLYDLTRHEDTAHNARKKKMRCHICAEEKLFSRADALARHMRVCHPDALEVSHEEGTKGTKEIKSKGASARFRERKRIREREEAAKKASKQFQESLQQIPEHRFDAMSSTGPKLFQEPQWQHPETRFDAMSSAGSSAGSIASAASYMSFGPRKGRRVAFQKPSYDNYKSLSPPPFVDQDITSQVEKFDYINFISYSPKSTSPPATHPEPHIVMPPPNNLFSHRMQGAKNQQSLLEPHNKRKADAISDDGRNLTVSNTRARQGTSDVELSLSANAYELETSKQFYQCTFCHTSFTRFSTWKRHEESSHTAPFIWICQPNMFRIKTTSSDCPVCTTSASIGHGSPRLPCPHRFQECWEKPESERVFYRRDTFRQHLACHFKGSDRRKQIIRYIDLENCKEESRSEIPATDLVCHFCGFSARTWTDRVEHIRIHFENGETMKSWIPGGPYGQT